LGAGDEADNSWEETAAGLAAAGDVLRSLQDHFGIELPVTWFFRADSLIFEQFGDCLAIFDKFARFIEQAMADGHEIGWMPQAYARASTGINYEDLTTTHAALTRAARAPSSVRMGNCFHDNQTMRLLSELGIKVDSSAMPGRAKDDLGWRMDWLATPARPYHPSVADYRQPGLPQLDILEVPLSVRPLQAHYDKAPLLRYLNPCMFRDLFWQNLRATIASSSSLVCIFHPDEAVAPRGSGGHPLVAYSKAELAFNLQELIAESSRMGRRISFHKLADFAQVMAHP
jgi:hypothetical protein